MLLAYLATLVTYLLLDAAWLGVIAKDSYKREMRHLLRHTIKKWPWFVFYPLHTAGIFILCITSSSATLTVVFKAALLGAIAYGTYNLTAYSIINRFPLNTAIKDSLWGIFATSLSGFIGFTLYSQHEIT